MGRYLSGPKGFSYKYVFAEQPDNLMALGAASGAGTAVVVPTFEALVEREERHISFNCIALARTIAAETGAKGELAGLLQYPTDAVPVKYADENPLEFVQYAMAEQIVEVLKRIDAQLPHAASHLFLVGTAGYLIEEAQYGCLLTWINGFLPNELHVQREALANSKGELDNTWQNVLRTLWGTEDFLPFMAFQILHHALTHGLPLITIQENGPGIEAENFWSLVPELGPPIFGETMPNTIDGLFARGLVQLFSGNPRDALKSLEACQALDGAQASRYLTLLHALKIT